MDGKAFFRNYVQDRQQQELPGFTREVLPCCVRYAAQSPGMEGLLCYTHLSPGQEQEEIARQKAWFAQKGQDVEWKVYELDTPANLKDLLQAQGFVADDEEAFMLFDLRQPAPATGTASAASTNAAAPVQIVRIVDEAGLRDVVAIQEAVWGRRFEWLLSSLLGQLQQHPEQISLYCARIDGQAVGCGWTGFPPGSRFPELHGGSVLPAFRGQGIYSALYRVRFEEMRARGFEFVTVDAAPMSRPILERIGFQMVCKTWPLRIKFASAANPAR